MPDDKNLENTIRFWGSILFHDKFLMSPETQFFVEHTVKYLQELRNIKSGIKYLQELKSTEEG